MSLSAHKESLPPVQFCLGLANAEQVMEFLKTLIAQNAQRMKAASSENLDSCGSMALLLPFKSSAAEYIIHLCDQWKYDEEVKFTAIEIFDKFFRSLLVEIFQSIFKTTSSAIVQPCSKTKMPFKRNHFKTHKEVSSSDKAQVENQDNLWKQTIDHIAGQMELRAVTCVSIASKISSHYCHVTHNMATGYLAIRGLRYKPGVLLKSEIRVLKTLKFNLGSLPLVHPYISALLDLLFMQQEKVVGQEIYQLCIDLLVCYYSRCQQVYEALFKDVKKSNDAKLVSNMSEAANDMVLLACGIVASATYLKSKCKSDSVVKMLSDLTEVPQEVIAKFSYVLLEESLK